VVIPTFNRSEDLKELLHSILKQTKPPKEIIVVDDSYNYKTRDLINRMQTSFSHKKVRLRYFRGGEEKRSISFARNIGAMNSTGEIILFLDDDVALDEKYIEEILKIYKKYPNAMGAQGCAVDGGITRFTATSRLLNSICKALFYFHTEKNSCRVLPSGMLTFPFPLTKTINCQWLSGTNSSYKNFLFKHFRFDENLIKYSLTEDADLSYRINRRYPDSLYTTPHAKFVHKASTHARMEMKQRITAGVVYHTYFFCKNMNQSLLKKMIFILSMLGILIDMFALVSLKKAHPRSIVDVICSYVYTLNHLREIKKGKLTL